MSVIRTWLKPGDLLLLALLLAPLALSWTRLTETIGEDTSDSLAALARVSGVLGLAMILLAGALSVRVPGFDRAFGGLTRLWQVHHFLGFGGLVLVMAHVLLLAASALPISRTLPVEVLFPSLDSVDVWLGWLALAALMIFLAPSFKFFGPPDYQRWKWLHIITAPTALVLALAHTLLLTPDAAAWWAIGGLAVASVVWRRVGSRLISRQPYTITAVQPLAADVVEISLRPEGRAIGYAPGQFVYLTPNDPALAAGRNEEHPYTISSAPGDSLRLGIKDLGDATHALQNVAVGTRVWIEGPYGDFLARLFPQRGQLWLGGGIGITPFVGGARALKQAQSAPTESVHLVYLADSRERAYYREEIEAAAKDTAGLDVTEHYFQKEGPISAEFLAQNCPDFAQREVYICGPAPMLAHLRRLLRKQGVSRVRIHCEEFALL
jgi:predicted ferric reductase